ncbi:MAG: 16S rRNA (guanine(966)-N(2))-methyltransferase RsmD [Ignavibacteriales bacterium CG_4_9_14_3_um_filter_30_11]|nr:MAG: 16S rRNA (guanine(966)-N(2))-methyltransferase RsmD [Ignavibacteriales bacterium CG_4_9_14_3_um_filter_30_11]
MRIIAGEYKGRTIYVPNSKLVRPTTDRVRETLFNLLNNKIDFEEINVLDIYAGSGSLGFESLSRGAEKVHFVEKNFVIYKNLETNIKKLKVEDKTKIFKIEAIKFSQIKEHERYDLILADPPFFKDDIYKVVDNIIINKYLADKGIMIIERSIQTKEKDIENLGCGPFKVIGDSCIYEMKNKF